MAARHQGLGRGFGEFFQRTDLETDEAVQEPDVSRETLTSQTNEPHEAARDAAADESGTPHLNGETITTDGTDTGKVSSATGGTGETDDSISRPSGGSTNAPSQDDGPTSGPSGLDAGTPLADGSRLQLIPVGKIHPNPRQPRRVFDEEALLELSESIAEVGLLQPVVETPDDGDTFELVMGERRWRASRLAGLDTIPTIVRVTDAQDMLRDALLENLHRSQLNPLEEAAAYHQMLDDFGCTQEELSQRIKRSRSRIANTLRLMKLPRSIQRYLLDGTLTAGHARALLSLDDREEQEHIANKIVDEGLSVRATEAMVQKADAGRTEVKPHTRRKPGTDEEAMKIASRLADVYDTDVTVKRTKTRGSGRIVLTFEDEDDLKRIMGILERDAAVAP